MACAWQRVYLRCPSDKTSHSAVLSASADISLLLENAKGNARLKNVPQKCHALDGPADVFCRKVAKAAANLETPYSGLLIQGYAHNGSAMLY